MRESAQRTSFETVRHQTDLCVVGGGMAGLLAAVSAARRGIRVLLMQDRPVFGGNASSEIRMWIRGAHGSDLQETGLLEGIALENIYRNPQLNYSIWDSVLYQLAMYQPNLSVLLNCSCCDLEMEDDTIKSVTGWQTTTQQWHRVEAGLFADCSGDSVLAPLSGARWRQGREAASDHDESIEPDRADQKTMGMSCLIQARETDTARSFTAPSWARSFKHDDFPFRLSLETPDAWCRDNFWWMELGGDGDSIRDTEKIRDELLQIAFGTWDFIKNSGYCRADNWELDWVGFLPGKRESRRYIGDHILTQNDILARGVFPDVVAYGGWTMDDHHPGGFAYSGPPNVFHPAPSPYGIPYRCLYSVNIANLFFAGRNISATHAALSSTRVMATCAMLGQAIGTAAALAIRSQLSPRGVFTQKISQLQQWLLEDDCYLPGHSRIIPDLMRQARLSAEKGDVSVLVNGRDRPEGGQSNLWAADPGTRLELSFDQPVAIGRLRLVCDSDLNRKSWQAIDSSIRRFPLRCQTFSGQQPVAVPKTLLRAYRVEATENGRDWQVVCRETNNYQRLTYADLKIRASRLRLIPEKTWGSRQTRLFALEVQP